VFSKNLRIGQRIALGFAISLATLAAIGVFSLRNLEEMERQAGWIPHTLEVLSEVRLVDEAVSRVESASRGYLLAGAENLKTEIAAQRASASASVGRLQLLTVDNASQQIRLARLELLLNRRLAAAQELVDLRDRDQGGSAGQVNAAVGEGQAISEEFHATADAVAAEETRLLAVRQDGSRQMTAVTHDTVIYGSLAALLLVGVSGYFLTRSVTGPLAQLQRSAARIGQGDYGHRAEIARQDETGHLSQVFNEMAEQVQRRELLLQEQQAELTQTNEELEQTNEEMEQTNEELEEKTNLLANQKRELENSNRLIELARSELQEQARQLTIGSTYKSNFLATMSHELRTPLNSLLILARLLAENREENLTPKQVQFARTIESSGADLLEMINQVLDLAKIESGTVELRLDDVSPGDLQRSLEEQFRHVAETKRLAFGISVASDLPERIHTDVSRLHQVLKNLLANAFKFTERGSVHISLRPAKGGWTRSSASLNRGPVIAISVKDTGIGIPKDKREIIFESFQQADAGIARRFGGTGLGLSISREIATLLGGELQLESDPGQGSTFTLFLPARLEAPAPPERAAPPRPPAARVLPAITDERAIDPPEIGDPEMDDDRAGLEPTDRVLLIIEDDASFARILVDLAREKHFKVLVAHSARRGLALAQRFVPAAITLDLRLSDDDGWLVLDRLKHDPRTRHIPVHVISVHPGRNRGLRLGAVSYLQKPVTREAIAGIFEQTLDFIKRPVKNLLVVEDDPVQRQTIQELIGNGDVHTTAVGTAAAALAALAATTYDCVVMDLMLPDQAGADLIREINRRLGLRSPPVIVYTGKDLSPREETELRSLSESIIVKDARSPERLLDETALFLHRVQSRLPESKRRMLEQIRRQDSVLTDRRVLVVDDDVRNIFALTAALEGYGMIVRFAESGQAALDLLQTDAAFDVILMDIMMPEMDGNEVIRRLRAEGRFAKLPIIAVTAKAMKGDRERSIESGASDYITKPVDTEKLASLLRVWLYR
jgi:CheY-like chemotaxis protein/signal transduction histidine kinase